MSRNSILALSLPKVLPKIWLALHYVCFIGSLLYSLYRFRQTSIAKISRIYASDWDTSDECLICWRPRDGTDLEWQIVKQYLISTPILYFVCHSLGFAFIRQVFPRYLCQFVAVYSSLVIIQTFNIEIYLLFILNCSFYILLDYLLKKYNSALFNIPYYITFIGSILLIQLLEPFQDAGDNLLAQVMISWLNAKCLSASMDRRSVVQSSKCPNSKYILRRFAYLLYFPPLFFGPIYHFSDFNESIDKLENGFRKFRTKLSARLFYVFRILSWAYFFEITKQFIFSSSFQYYIFLLEKFDSWSLAGYGFALTIMFYLKYLVIYGISKSFAELDGLEDVIAMPPECIAHMHRTSYLWRRFDQGLYKFLVKYFYKPLTGSSRADPIRKFLAGMVCFGVIAVWHGLNLPVLIWVSLNVLLSAAEIVGIQLLAFLPQQFRTKYPFLIEQFSAVIGAPYLSLAYLSNVFFLSNFESGFLLWTHFYITDFSIFFMTMIAFWSGNYVCKHINDNIRSNKSNSIVKNN